MPRKKSGALVPVAPLEVLVPRGTPRQTFIGQLRAARGRLDDAITALEALA